MKMMRSAAGFAAAVLLTGALASCQDDLTTIGESMARGEVTIVMDESEVDIPTEPIYIESIDSRTYNKLLGRINVPEYGKLDCSFVTQMVCANKMNVPDSIAVSDVDSVRLVMSIPRGALVGDSLAPQQLRVYRLNKQLPSDINSSFDPRGYYDPSTPWGERSYTASVINRGDSAVKNDRYVAIEVKLPTEFGRDIFSRYRANDPIFEWPATFNEFFPGIYIEQNFGNGCVSNITKTEIYTYWHRKQTEREKVGDEYQDVVKTYRDSVCLMSSQPIVLSSNNIKYEPSASLHALAASGASVVTSPSGYAQTMTMPVDMLLNRYAEHNSGLSVVSSLSVFIPATTVSNDYGIGMAPYMLMVKKSELDGYFEENKLPDGVNSFYAAYDSEKGGYLFSGLRQYFLNIYNASQSAEGVDAADTEFVILPVMVSTETVEGYNTSTTYVTKCLPYMTKPTMTLLDSEHTTIYFTFSNQEIE